MLYGQTDMARSCWSRIYIFMGSETSHIRYRVGNAPEAPAVIAFIGSETLPNLWGRKRFLLPVSYFPTIWGRKRFVPFVTYFPTNRVGNASFYRLHTFPRIFYILSDEFSSETLPSTCKTLPSAFISIPVTRRFSYDESSIPLFLRVTGIKTRYVSQGITI